MDPGKRTVSGPATSPPEPSRFRPRRPSRLPPVLVLLAANAHATVPSTFQYQRPVTTSSPGEACAVLDPAIFPHAAPALRDLRLFSATPNTAEIPYLLTISEAQQTDPDAARILNLTRNEEAVDFDLAMPPRPYTEVVLDLPAQNFLATADVTGLGSTPGAHPIPLGQFTLFDLTAQHLSRNNTIALQESTFPTLHVRLRFQSSTPGQAAPLLPPQIIRAATVPPSREQQVLFETALAARPQVLGQTTAAHFDLPRRLPIERVLFRLAPGFPENFIRTVRISAHAVGGDAPETTTATIARIRRDVAGLHLRQQRISVPATIGANLQGPAELTVTVDNGPDTPLPITSVELQVRQRKLCFHAGTDPLTLAYGDPELRAPEDATQHGLSIPTHVTTARLGPETVNPQWQPRPEQPPARRRQPHLFWVVLLGLAVLFGVVAVRASRVVSR